MSFVDAINSTKQGNKALQPKIEYALGNAYVAQMKIGTPPDSALLLVDTGSDDTWVQGEGCKNCFHVRDGNFNYHMSGTYHRLSCDDPLCVPKICEENFCRYEISYYDGTYSAGPISTETFTFTMDGGGSIDYHNLVFGVGLDNQNIVFAQELGSRNIASGIFGLGVGKRSFLRQLEADTDLRFSYCFPTNHEPGIYTYLRFGKDATISGNDLGIVQTTPIIPGQDRYYVQVLKISMNGKDLPIDKVDFQLRSDSRGGFVIDSGISQTFLVESAYKVVRDEIVSFLQAYNLNPVPRSDSTLEICYKDVQETENLPSLTIHFLGAKLKLESSRIFAYDANHNLCMFIQPSPQQGLNILGAFQQKDHRFLIDVKTSTMYFVPENCHNN